MARYLCVACIFTIFVSSCGLRRFSPPVFINYTTTFNDHLSDASTLKSETRHKIGYYKNYNMYAVSSLQLTLRNSIKKNDSIINEMVESPDTIFRYFIIKNNASIGLVYNSVEAKSGSYFHLDSLLEAINLQPSNLRIFNLALGEPFKVVKHGHKVVEVFLEDGIAGKDTTYRYYDKQMSKLRFSFSDSLDKAKRKKLYATKFTQYRTGAYNFNSNKNVISTDLFVSIGYTHPKNKDKLLGLFLNFEHDCVFLKCLKISNYQGKFKSAIDYNCEK